MESSKRIIIGVLFFVIVFVVTIYLSGVDSSLAIIFNLFCFGVASAYQAKKKSRSTIGWFCAGFFGGIVGFAFAISMENID